jgi:hypothetical protein
LGHDGDVVLLVLHLRLDVFVLRQSRLELGVPHPEIIKLPCLALQQPIEPIKLSIHHAVLPLSILILLLDDPQVVDVGLVPRDFVSEVLDRSGVALKLVL